MHQRNELLSLLSRLYPAHLALQSEQDQDWDPQWRHVVCIHFRRGFPSALGLTIDGNIQASWPIPDDDLPLFSHLELRENDSEGHTLDQQYARLRRLP